MMSGLFLAESAGAEWISAISNAVLAVAAIVGGYIAYREFSNAQKWKRVEVAAQYVENLWVDPKIQACCVFLDWQARLIRVPDEYSGLIDGTHFTHTTAAMRQAMNRTSENAAPAPLEFSWQEVLYRDYFDRFFEYLGQCQDALDLGLVKSRDLLPLKYWLDKLLVEYRDIFAPFLTQYKYDKIAKLHARLELASKSTPKR